jgi:predicted SnoaL-like aldol condensation-catalyzing enzyme
MEQTIMQAEITNKLSFNKQLAKDCLDTIFNQHKVDQAVAHYIGANYRQHNPNTPDGPQGVIVYATEYIKANPELHMNFKRIIAEGNLVLVHSHLNPTQKTSVTQ